MCGSACGTFCLLTSIFGVVFLGIMGTLLKNDYKHIGEWYEVEKDSHGLPTGEQIDNAYKAVYATAGVYGGFIVLSLGCLINGARRK
ncbi:hypothetical protein BSKO_07526 [Bryopsis sp. KO-2023]|nr:hypothetical protein BSKO_07526 [Bryopsis sp. KO-2023]